MPGLITHLAFAQKAFQNKKDHDLVEVMVGTVLPDIDFTGVIKREETHVLPILQNSDQSAGYAYHLALDKKFGKSIYSPDQDKITILACRLLVDEILWGSLTQIEELLERLRNPKDEDIFARLSVADIKLWFGVVAKYIAKRPNDVIRAEIAEDFQIPADLMETIEKKIEKPRSDGAFNMKVFTLYRKGFGPKA